MSDQDFATRLHTVMIQLRELATEYHEIKFTASEEAIRWPMAVVVEDDGEVGLWCNKEECTLDCENSRIDVSLESFTVADLIYELTSHVEADRDRRRWAHEQC